MLSIIVCSKYSKLNASFCHNIECTVGCDYEMIHIDNSQNNYNIFQAYNLGVSLSRGDVLCFMHEDVRFHSSNWGKLSCDYLKDKKIGAIGVAGGHAVLSQSDWRMYGCSVVNLRQGYYCVSEESEYYCSSSPNKATGLTRVAVLDGVWFCIRKELFEKIRFDEDTFNDFHLYDSDICMQINRLGLSVCVCADVDLEHFSVGTYTEGFLHSLNKFLVKWKDSLPCQIGVELTDKEVLQLEKLGIIQLNARIHADRVLLKLREKLRMKKAGACEIDFTNEELNIMRRSAYQCVKSSIKDRDKSFADSYSLYQRLMKHDTLSNKLKLFLKMVFYKVKYYIVSFIQTR